MSRQFLTAAALAGLLAAPATAQHRILTFNCDLGGAPAQMQMAVEYQQAFGLSTNQPSNSISGIFPTGVTVYTAGQVVSQVAQYTFRGENDFADFLDHTTGQTFRVQWVLDGANNGVWMKVNPFGGTTTYFCALAGVQ